MRMIHFCKTQLAAYQQQRKITSLDMVFFWRQFATLVAANIPIIQICEILEKSQRKILFTYLIQDIKRELLRGKNLFQSLCRHQTYFDELTCRLIHIGEHTGRLDLMSSLIAEHQEKNLVFKKKLKKALFYPCIITLITFLLTFFMFIFIIPRFSDLFKDTPTKLPLLTLWIFFFSDQLNQHLFTIISMMLASTTIIYFYFPLPIKNKLRDCCKRLPLISSYQHKITLAKFSRNLAIAFNTGIPIKESLQLSTNNHSDSKFVQSVIKLTSKINAGLQFHHAMENLGFFPDIMVQMIKIGEETGMLDQMLNKIADFFESEVDLLLDQFGILLEPLIMLMLGVLIGGIVIAMYLPVFNLGSVL